MSDKVSLSVTREPLALWESRKSQGMAQRGTA